MLEDQAVEGTALSSVIDYAIIVENKIYSVVRWNGDTSTWKPSEGYAIPLSEAIEQGFLHAKTQQARIVTAANFINHLESHVPGLIQRIWDSDEPAAKIAATRLFTLAGEFTIDSNSTAMQIIKELVAVGVISQSEVSVIIGDV